ncbi:MAG: hypothetical protein HZA37_01775, partial [Parcubacteria group bacterium]|nr:hypothetical protein [Parcubacteria group bacterium]
GEDSVSWSEYATRWRNLVCLQTDWTGGTGTATTTCPATTFGSQSSIDASGGSLKLTQ